MFTAKMIKRLIEIIFSFILLLLFFPMMCLIALAIKLETPGPVIFKQKRVGFRDRIFALYKFRTMFCHVDPLGTSPAGNKDKRITRVGRFLRKYKLDELPQFYNILKGDMSFVGPRPQLLNELKELQDVYPDLLKKRLTVRPGITCFWAIARGQTKIKPTYEMLVEDCRYVDIASLWVDIKILFRTFIYVLSNR